ncbi:MAG: hypothetical protein ACP5P4_11925 [Steroidobacteraceae bacterium]
MSASGSPDTTGVIGELVFLPWPGVKLSMQYAHYTRFNGGATDYDGLGRDVSGNDTLSILLRLPY